MDQLPLVVSFYTKNTPYEEEVDALRRSCKAFGIDCLIEGVVSMGSWEMNCAFKPLFLLEKLEKLNRPLLWVDADAVFLDQLSWQESFIADVAVRLYPCADDHRSRIVSSTVFVNATAKARFALQMWAIECTRRLQDRFRIKEVWDQEVLRDVLFKREYEIDWRPLPESYLMIAGHPLDESLGFMPVILQYQASRRCKKFINDLGLST